VTAFSAAVDAIFADPNMAADATWAYQGVGTPLSCRVILKRPDDMTEFGGARIISDTVIADVRVSDVADPQPGDVIVIGADYYTVQGKPSRDRERLVWTMELEPE